MVLNKPDQVLNIIGLAYRARKVITGEDTVLRLLKQNKFKIVFVASDAAIRTIDKFEKKCFYYKTPLNINYNTAELSNAVGKPMCKILAITDQGFFDALMKSLNGGAINEG